MVRAPAAARKPACGACRGPASVRAPGARTAENLRGFSEYCEVLATTGVDFCGGGGILSGCSLDSIEAPVRRAIMSKASSLGTALFAALLITLVWWPWTSSAIADPCQDCFEAPPATCSGFAGVTCWGSGCQYTSSGCPTIGNLAAKQCAPVETGGFAHCYPQYTPCGNIAVEVIHPCILCFPDTTTTYTSPCPGAFQTDCDRNGACVPGFEPGIPA